MRINDGLKFNHLPNTQNKSVIANSYRGYLPTFRSRKQPQSLTLSIKKVGINTGKVAPCIRIMKLKASPKKVFSILRSCPENSIRNKIFNHIKSERKRGESQTGINSSSRRRNESGFLN